MHGVDRDVAAAGDDRAPSVKLQAARGEQLLHEVDAAVAGRLRPSEAAAVLDALAGQHAGLVAAADALVLAEHVADLARADADVARRHVDVGAEVLLQLGHEALREAHDLQVRLALRIEVRASLAATDRLAGQRVLERLLEAEELDDAGVDGRVEADAALVWTERAVELHAEAAVHLHPSLIVDPRHAEGDEPVRLDEALQDGMLAILRMADEHGLHAFEKFLDGLMELGLLGIAPDDAFIDGLQVGSGLGTGGHGKAHDERPLCQSSGECVLPGTCRLADLRKEGLKQLPAQLLRRFGREQAERNVEYGARPGLPLLPQAAYRAGVGDEHARRELWVAAELQAELHELARALAGGAAADDEAPCGMPL